MKNIEHNITRTDEDKYLKLHQSGYYFDFERKTFYSKSENFIKPEGSEFETWEIETFDEKKYYNQRIHEELGLSENNNVVLLYENENKKGKLIENKIFTTNKYGDIEIGLYSLDRVPFVYHKTIASHTNIVEKEDVIIRYAPWRSKILGRKYHISGITGTHPFLHPELIKAYEEKTEIKTLAITEGAFKAFKATSEGLFTVGLSSITHYIDKEEATIHPDIIKLIKECKVQNVVILWDGDCLDISLKALKLEEDLIKRPIGFYSSAKKIRDQLRDFVDSTKIYFAHIQSSNLSAGHPKGIDDLLTQYASSKQGILEDFENIGDIPGRYIKWIDISLNSQMKKFYAYFKLNNVDHFYERHSLKITDKKFTLGGTTYQYNYEKSEIEVLVPANAKEYMRIGTDYYHKTKVQLSTGSIGEELLKWKQSTIIQDHGKKFLEHIAKYKKFVNKPSHDKYEQIIHNCYNTYFEIKHEPKQGSWSSIEKFLKHIFDDHYKYALDYIQLLYTKPEQKLPILCLVSRDNETGKSTFINLLKWIFQNNMAIIGNSELESDFNSGWITKLIIASEETFLDKKSTMEKIKAMSTSETMSMNQKGVDLVQVAFHGKFVFASNNEDSFIKIGKEDKRYWIRKVNSINKEDIDPLFNDKLKEEIPAFIHFLLDRKMHVSKKLGRMWFNTDKLRTEAFYNVANNSVPTIEKEIRIQLEDMFYNYGLDTIKLSLSDIQERFKLNKFDKNYIKLILRDNLNVEIAKNGKGEEGSIRYEIPNMNFESGDITFQKVIGRPYVFNRKDFIECPDKTIDELEPDQTEMILE